MVLPAPAVRKDPTQALVSNFWEMAANRGFESSMDSDKSDDVAKAARPAHVSAPALLGPATPAKALEAKALLSPTPTAEAGEKVEESKIPSAKPPPIATAALDFWQNAASKSANDVKESNRRREEQQREQRPAEPEKPPTPKGFPRQAPTPSTNLKANQFWQAAAKDAYDESSDGDPGSQILAADNSGPAPTRSSLAASTHHGNSQDLSGDAGLAEQQTSAERRQTPSRGGGLAAAGKQQSARLAAIRLRQAAAVRQTSLAAVKSGTVSLNSAASIRSSALRAAEDAAADEEKKPFAGSSHGRLLWARASENVLGLSSGESSPAGASPPKGASPTRGQSLVGSSSYGSLAAAEEPRGSRWVRSSQPPARRGSRPNFRGVVEALRSETSSQAKELPEPVGTEGDSFSRLQRSLQAGGTSGSGSSLFGGQPSMDLSSGVQGSRTLSNVISPFNSALPPIRTRSQERSDREKADEEAAQEIFRAAQARKGMQ